MSKQKTIKCEFTEEEARLLAGALSAHEKELRSRIQQLRWKTERKHHDVTELLEKMNRWTGYRG